MLTRLGHFRIALALLVLPLPACTGAGRQQASVCPCPLPLDPVQVSTEAPPAPLSPPAPAACDRPLPINLATALQLTGAQAIDIALAAQRVQLAIAQLKRARVLGLPTILMGADYFRHDGQIQDIVGNVFGTSKSALQLGAAPYAVFGVTDAIFGPLVVRQEVQARKAQLQVARNDTLLAVAESYFNVQQARGELAGAEDAVRRAREVAATAEKLGKDAGLVPDLEVARARTEVARRNQLVQSARERWRTASAELARLLRLDPAALVEPLEPPHLQITLIGPDRPLEELIGMALTSRPELASQQALVQAALHRLRTERVRPLLPSVLLRGASTNPGGTLAGGYFGGGINSFVGNFSSRSDFDVQLLWVFENLGLGNRARQNEQRVESRLAVLELIRIKDRIAAEVAQAYAQARSAAARIGEAEAELKDAVESADKNLQGLSQTNAAVAGRIVLLVRPQEVVASIQALGQAYTDYFGAIADYDRAQFRLYRVLGQPAQAIAEAGVPCPPPGGERPAAWPDGPAGRDTARELGVDELPPPTKMDRNEQ